MFNSSLRHRNQSRKRSIIVGLALCFAATSTCFARPREVFVTDSYDGLEYHFSEKIAKAIARDKKSNLFRITVFNDGPTSGWSNVSAIYNRKQKTLKTHYYSDWWMVDDEAKRGEDLAHRRHTTIGWIYRNVTDAKLRKLATMKNESYIFGDGDIDGRDKDLVKLKIKSRQLYNRKSYWDIQPGGKLTRARWTFDERTATYRYPKR